MTTRLKNSDAPHTPEVLHVITGLEAGGAEHSLIRLLAEHQGFFNSRVLSLRGHGALTPLVRQLATVYSLNIGGSLRETARGCLSASRAELRASDVVQGWMHHGNLAALSIRKSPNPLIWNIRKTIYDIRTEKPGTRVAIVLGARLSGMTDAITYNSTVAQAQHQAMGYRAPLDLVIHNGIDIDDFRPDQARRRAARLKIGAGPSDLVVIRVGRNHPMKNHHGFLRSMARVLIERPNALGVIAGRGVGDESSKLGALADDLGIRDRIRLLPDTREVSQLLSGADLVCSSSIWGESFPNVVAEGMACGLPAVSTDVGDSKIIVGEGGRVVRPGDDEELARGITDILENSELRARLGEYARRRIRDNFSLAVCGTRFRNLYTELLERRHCPQA